MILKKTSFWIILLLSIFLIAYSISGVLLPFILAFIVSYFLNPLVNRLESIYIPRGLAAFIVIMSFFVITGIIIIKMSPIIYSQLQYLIIKIPSYKQIFSERIDDFLSRFSSDIKQSITQKISKHLQDLIAMALHSTTSLLLNIWQSGVDLLYILSIIFLTPIIAFYLMKDWPYIIDKSKMLIPIKERRFINKLFSEIDISLSCYIRGQVNVCIILAIYYSLCLSIIKMDFALIVGVLSGFLVFIPYLGFIFGITTSIIISYLQFGDIDHIALVSAIFIIGQALEGNFITPKIIGDKIGIHPVWLFFIVLSGAKLFGFVGVLLAVPMSAIFTVLAKSAVKQYLKSSYYIK